MPQVIVTNDVAAAITDISRNAALMFLGFDAPVSEEADTWHAGMQRLVAELEDVILVSNAGDLKLEA